MARRNHNDNMEEMSGQDSFLDIIANIVGILILLVVIVGIRAATAVATGDSDQPPIHPADPDQPSITQAMVQDIRQQTLQVATQAVDSKRKALLLEENAAQLDADRVRLATYIEEVEQALAQRRAELEAEDQHKLDLRIKLSAAEEKLDHLTRKQIALASAPSITEELKNIPTPIARSVEGDEVQLRVEAGRVSVVPWDAINDSLKGLSGSDARRRLLGQSDGIMRVGPVEGYEVLIMVLAAKGVGQGGTTVTIPVPMVEIRPLHPPIGEPIDEALQPDSALMAELAAHPPRTATVTLWAYPDSFGDIHTLREMLYNRGYATAVRPLGEGRHIGGSPFGSRSQAQ